MTSRLTLQRAILRLVATLALAMVAAEAGAQTYTVEIRPTLNDLDIKIEHIAHASMLTINLTNNTDQRVRCDLRYDASPQTLRRSTTFVNPGRTEANVFRAQRRWHRVIVDVQCSAVQS